MGVWRPPLGCKWRAALCPCWRAPFGWLGLLDGLH
ncbi:hypothetical protein L195_g062332, partial [Trifolium pratense]